MESLFIEFKGCWVLDSQNGTGEKSWFDVEETDEIFHCEESFFNGFEFAHSSIELLRLLLVDLFESSGFLLGFGLFNLSSIFVFGFLSLLPSFFELGFLRDDAFLSS